MNPQRASIRTTPTGCSKCYATFRNAFRFSSSRMAWAILQRIVHGFSASTRHFGKRKPMLQRANWLPRYLPNRSNVVAVRSQHEPSCFFIYALDGYRGRFIRPVLWADWPFCQGPQACLSGRGSGAFRIGGAWRGAVFRRVSRSGRSPSRDFVRSPDRVA